MSSQAPFLSRLLALFLAIGLAYGALLAYRLVPDTVRNQGLEDLQSQIAASEQQHAISTLDLLDQSTRPLEVLPIPPMGVFSPLDWNIFIDKLRRKVFLLHHLENNDYNNPDVLPTIALLKANERDAITNAISLLKVQKSSIEKLVNKIESLNGRKQQLQQQTFLLLSDLRAFLSLYPEPVTDTPTVRTYYKSGLLLHLPKITEIPIPPLNMTELRDMLTELRLPLPQMSKNQFLQKLNSLKETGKRIEENLESTTEKEEELQESLSEQELSQAQTNELIKGTMTRILKNDITYRNL